MTDRTVGDHGEWERQPRSRRAGWLAVLLIVALAVTLAGIFPFRQMIAQHRQVATAEEQLEALTTENARLEEEVVALETPAEIERIAREELGLVRPGEKGYVVEEPPSRPGVEPVPGVDIPTEGRSFFGRVWDFLSGRDLSADG